MDEQKRGEEPAKDADLKRPEDAIKDLEPEEGESDAVKGGGTDIFMKVGEIKGE